MILKPPPGLGRLRVVGLASHHVSPIAIHASLLVLLLLPHWIVEAVGWTLVDWWSGCSEPTTTQGPRTPPQWYGWWTPSEILVCHWCWHLFCTCKPLLGIFWSNVRFIWVFFVNLMWQSEVGGLNNWRISIFVMNLRKMHRWGRRGYTFFGCMVNMPFVLWLRLGKELGQREICTWCLTLTIIYNYMSNDEKGLYANATWRATKDLHSKCKGHRKTNPLCFMHKRCKILMPSNSNIKSSTRTSIHSHMILMGSREYCNMSTNKWIQTQSIGP